MIVQVETDRIEVAQGGSSISAPAVSVHKRGARLDRGRSGGWEVAETGWW